MAFQNDDWHSMTCVYCADRHAMTLFYNAESRLRGCTFQKSAINCQLRIVNKYHRVSICTVNTCHRVQIIILKCHRVQLFCGRSMFGPTARATRDSMGARATHTRPSPPGPSLLQLRASRVRRPSPAPASARHVSACCHHSLGERADQRGAPRHRRSR